MKNYRITSLGVENWGLVWVWPWKRKFYNGAVYLDFNFDCGFKTYKEVKDLYNKYSTSV